MNEIPLSDASMSEVCARVAYRTLVWYYNRTDYGEAIPQELMIACSHWLRSEGFDMLAMWLLAYERHYAPLYRARDTRDMFIWRSRQGYSWRRVVYPAYKSARRDPRVTNRGVTSRPLRGEK